MLHLQAKKFHSKPIAEKPQKNWGFGAKQKGHLKVALPIYFVDFFSCSTPRHFLNLAPLPLRLIVQRFSSANNFQNLIGNGRLSCLVVGQLQLGP